MVTTTESTVPVDVMWTQGGRMENYQNILMYKLAMHMAEDMKNRGIITDEEYVRIEQKIEGLGGIFFGKKPKNKAHLGKTPKIGSTIIWFLI